jgi:hypothetical protein
VQLNLSHQHYLVDPTRIDSVTVIGVGSVGSNLVTMLAHMGVEKISVWDADFVASHNVPASSYGHPDVGSLKVKALHDRVLRDTGVKIHTHETMYAGERLDSHYVVSCVDDMDARKVIWDYVRDHPRIRLFCDTRMNKAFVDVISVQPLDARDIDRYNALWFPNEEAQQQMCGTHGVIFGTARAATIVAANINSFAHTRDYRWRVTERCDTLERIP